MQYLQWNRHSSVSLVTCCIKLPTINIEGPGRELQTNLIPTDQYKVNDMMYDGSSPNARMQANTSNNTAGIHHLLGTAADSLAAIAAAHKRSRCDNARGVAEAKISQQPAAAIPAV